MSEKRSEQELVRREKLTQLRGEGYPFPNDVSLSGTSKDVLAELEEEVAKNEAERTQFTIAGRLVQQRLMGKAAFCHISDRAGKIQLYVRKDDVGEDSYAAFKEFDLGDIVEVSGYLFTTKTGEATIYAKQIRLLVKCLHPLPEKFHGLTDVEMRYRQRYLDLMVNEESREVFRKRAKIISGIRRFFDNHGYLEVETPVMHSVASGANARPFVTHHNALGIDLHLRIALELPLKKLVVGGFERVYEMSRIFRNEGISTQHNPEFTMIEFYQAYATYEDLMNLTEELIVSLCDDVLGSRKITFDGQEIDMKPPWKRLTVRDALRHYTSLADDTPLDSLEDVHSAAKQLGAEHITEIDDYGRALYELFDEQVEDKLIGPVFITEFPLAVSPLSRPNQEDGRFVDRFELFVAGMELANAFSELNDADDQRKRFDSQLALKEQGDEEAMVIDEDFCTALEYGLPPTAGEGIGIDRLVMVLTDSPSIRDVILFPQMRPQE